MSKAEELYLQIGRNLEGAEESQMFGKPCFKINKKAFICFFQDEMVFKLQGEEHQNALSLDGSQLFDPSGKQRPMKEWVQVSFANSNKWPEFANSAFNYVSSNLLK